MEDVLEYLTINFDVSIRNHINDRMVEGSQNFERGWVVSDDEYNVVLESEDIDEVIDCFNFEY